MNSKWLVAFVALCLGIGALFYSAKQATVERSPYALFEPGMTIEQTIVVQRQIDRQLRRKSGGQTQVSQIATVITVTSVSGPLRILPAGNCHCSVRRKAGP